MLDYDEDYDEDYDYEEDYDYDALETYYANLEDENEEAV